MHIMNRQELTQYIAGVYNTDPDHPWASDPGYAVFRHRSSRKWFALLMDIPAEKLGLEGGTTDVVNLRTDPVMSGSLRSEPGIFPAYHMNKANWISVVIDMASDDLLKMLLDISFQLTAPKPKKHRTL